MAFVRSKSLTRLKSGNSRPYFCWSAWVASALRPGRDYSYTNNWPPEPLVGNRPTAATIIWSMLSLAALLGGVGLLLAAIGRWNFLGWHGREQQTICFAPSAAADLTKDSPLLRRHSHRRSGQFRTAHE